MEITLQHFSHEHPLVLDRMVNIGETCNACSRTVDGLGFICSDCGFLLHKRCTKLPQETQHHLHPQHPLKLHLDPPQNSKCSLCGETHHGFVFRCDECQYNIDVNCFLRTDRYQHLKLQQRTREFQHFSHPHALVLRFIGHGSGPGGSCRGCGGPVSGPTYCCAECPEFFLHKPCAQLPEQIRHPFHQPHPLSLLTKSPYLPGTLLCNGCRNPIDDNNFVFHCSTCKFDLDVACVSRKPSVKDEKHEHGLALFEDINPRIMSFPCRACSNNCTEHFYRCVGCNFNIHSNCLTLQSSVRHKNHPHALFLRDPDVEDGLACEGCRGRITPKHRFYNCGECGYGLHLECVEPEDSLVKLAEDIKAEMKRLDAESHRTQELVKKMIDLYLHKNVQPLASQDDR